MKHQILKVKSLVFVFVSVLWIYGMPGISDGQVCQVGDVISPGGRCRVDGAETGWFSVLPDGSSVYQEGGLRLDFADGAECGDFAARKQTDGTWLIEAVRVASVVTPPMPRQMYWSELDTGARMFSLMGANVDGSNQRKILLVSNEVDVDNPSVDPVEGKIYYLEGILRVGDAIRRMNLDGSGMETVRPAESFKHSLALDVAGRKMYWYEELTGVMRANLDGSNAEILTPGEFRTFTLDIAGGKIYGYRYPFDREAVQIVRANLDGSNEEVIIERPFRGPWGLFYLDAIGVVDGKLYWFEHRNWDGRGFTPPYTSRIIRANLDGSNQQTIIQQSGDLEQLNALSRSGFDVAGRKVYWTEHFEPISKKNRIWRANLDGSNLEHIATRPVHISRFAFDPILVATLTVESLQSSNNRLVPGESFTLSAVVGNSSDVESSPTPLRYYRLPATEVGSMTVRRIAGGDTSRAQVCLVAPTTPGTYYYGVGIGDGLITETVEVTVKPESDLAFGNFVTNIKTDAGTVEPGASFRLAVIATNRGKGESSPTTLRYYQSTDETFTADDTEVGKTDLSPLAVGSLKRHHVFIKAPTAPGVYFYGACIDPVDEERITDNNCTAAIKVTVKSPSAVAIESLESSNNRLLPGESFRLSGVVRSTGEKKSLLTTLRYYRATDEDFTSDVTEVGETDVPALAPDATSDVSITLTAPSVPGVYYYRACIGSIGTNCSPSVKITVVLEPKVLIAASERPPLYWMDGEGGTLHRLIGAKVEDLLPNVRNATALAVDVAAGKLYWSEKIDDRTGSIRTATLNGSNVKRVKDLTSVPLDIALDTAAGKLYLINAWGKVQRMNLDGSNFQPNLIVDLEAPQHLTLDVVHRKIYWTEQTGEGTGRIHRANFDGSNVERVKALTSVPLSLAADLTNGQLYLTNAWGKIQQLRFDGSNFRPNFITDLESPRIIAVDAIRGKVYWTEVDRLRRANLNGENVEDVVRGLVWTSTGITLGPTVADTPPGVSPTDDTGLTEAAPDAAEIPTLTDLDPSMYWIEALNGIWRANLDGSNRKFLFPAEHAFRIQVDRIDEKIYWIDRPPDTPTSGSILRANLDGSNVETLIHVLHPHDLALDVAAGKIYWTDRPPDALSSRRMMRANLDGSNVELIRASKSMRQPVLDGVDKKIYWVEQIWSTRWNPESNPGSRPEFQLEFRRANLDGSNVEALIERSSQVEQSNRVRWLGHFWLDVAGGKLYWMEQIQSFDRTQQWLLHDYHIMMRANLDGSNQQFVAKLSRNRMERIAFDAGSQKVYWTERIQKTSRDYRILRMSLEGSNIEELWTEKGMGKSWLEAFAFDRLPRSELAIESLQASSRRFVRGESFRLSGVIRSKSGEKSSPTTLWYYRARNNSFTVATGVGKTDVPSLAPEATSDVSITLTAPAKPGAYYYIACVGSVGKQRITKNNCSLAVRITVEAKSEVLIAASERPPLYWMDGEAGTLHRLIGGKVEDLLPNVQNATALAVDVAAGKLYWTEKTSNKTGKIRRANLDGTNVKLVKNLTSVPLDITLDTAAGKLYLINAWGKMQRMNLDGSNFQPNLIVDLEAPQHLTLDVAHGKIYWTERTGAGTGKIMRADLDGANVEQVKALTSAPLGLAADVTNGKLYLTSSFDKIQQLSFDGSNFHSNFITGLVSPREVAVDARGGKVYWTEGAKVRRADLNGENVEDVVQGLPTPAGITLGITAGQTGRAAPQAVAVALPDETALLTNYPNPFNPETWIPYQLSKPADVTLHIYAMNGALVRRLALGHQPAGVYKNRSRAVHWDGRNALGEKVASGLYFYTFTAGDFTATRKMLILK